MSSASMGPGCFHPRNIATEAIAALQRALQWGRDVSIPEIGLVVQVVDAVVVASMGPGCFHPRNRPPSRRDDLILAASMGPGCFHPKNASERPKLSHLFSASMGPGC